MRIKKTITRGMNHKWQKTGKHEQTCTQCGVVKNTTSSYSFFYREDERATYTRPECIPNTAYQLSIVTHYTQEQIESFQSLTGIKGYCLKKELDDFMAAGIPNLTHINILVKLGKYNVKK